MDRIASEKDERSLPVPETPYGGSKLVAENIHMAWQRGGGDRRLVIVRPGVYSDRGRGRERNAFGEGSPESIFFLLGNRHTRKARRRLSYRSCVARCYGCLKRRSTLERK